MDEEEGEMEEEVKEAANDGGSKKERESRKSAQSRASTIGASQQQLFLVEFLVDTVTIDACSVDEEVLQGQTCLTLSFLNFPPLEICEKDFDPNKEVGLDKVRFNCGKSLMFAMNEKQCQNPPLLSLEIVVSKKLREDEENPCKVEIGVIKVCMAELFRQIVEIALFKPDKLPTSKAIKDCFMLVGPGKRTMGQVSVYIRLSCLGQNVVTEFQCGPDLKTNPVIFKSREGKKIYEFSGNEAQGEGEESCPPGAGSPGAGRSSGKTGGRGKPGCGCILPPPGGQGDGGKSVNTYTKGNRVVLDVPRPEGRGGVEGRAGDCGNRSKPKADGRGMTLCPKEPNPDHNCFVLRVGDKGQIPDRGKMILEFKTPKQRILPKVLPPYHEEVAVQTDSGKGKGKGKKKK